MGFIVLLGIYFIPPVVAAIVVRRRRIKVGQKRPNGLVVCNVVFVLTFFISLMVAFIAAISGPSNDETIKGPSPLRLIPIFFPTIVSVSTIGLWHRQKWGRICSLFVAAIVFVSMAYVVYGSLFLVPKEMALQNHAFAATVVVIGMVYAGIVYYLTRPKIKEQFK